MDHSLLPLGLFLQIKLKFLSLSQTHLLRHNERCSNGNWSQYQKLPLFPIINTSPHKKPPFDNNSQWEYFDKAKALFYYFSKFSSGSWSIYCFGLYFLPLWHQAPKRDQSWPFNPIASPKSATESKKAIRVLRWTWKKLLVHRSAVEVFHGPSPPFPFQTSFETKSGKLKHIVSLKGSSCSTSPPKFMHHLQRTCEVRGVHLQLEHH
jgi:hypothetical protein